MMPRLSQMLVLHMLDLDDEPMNLVINEANVNENSKVYLRDEFKGVIIDKDETKEALISLLVNGMIILLDENGEFIETKNISEELKKRNPEDIWFRMTPHGKRLFEEHYSRFWL